MPSPSARLPPAPRFSRDWGTAQMLPWSWLSHRRGSDYKAHCRPEKQSYYYAHTTITVSHPLPCCIRKAPIPNLASRNDQSLLISSCRLRIVPSGTQFSIWVDMGELGDPFVAGDNPRDPGRMRISSHPAARGMAVKSSVVDANTRVLRQWVLQDPCNL